MQKNLRRFVFFIVPLFDVLFLPVVVAGSIALLIIRTIGVKRFALNRRIFETIGIFPIRDHYYDPLFKTKHLKSTLDKERFLPGIDLNIDKQLLLLSYFSYAEELRSLPATKPTETRFYFKNPAFPPGDSECLYSVIRHFKPRQIIEIGSGYSTLMAIEAIKKNTSEHPEYACEHTCIEPYENQWLDGLPCKIIRRVVEKIDLDFFRSLRENDILFIDSTHMIKPEGDVLKEYLEILPILNKGVIVHIHDIFTPRNYPKNWIVDDVLFWNEQYLMEAFLSGNREFEVLLAVNFLSHNHPDKIKKACPILASESGEPGSFWIRKLMESTDKLTL